MVLREPDIRRVISSLINTQLTAFRSAAWQTALHPPEARIGEDGLGADSLEWISLATSVAEMFHLREAGVQEYLVRYRTIGEWAEVVRFALTEGVGNITFRTSGSTGAPVACTHPIGGLEEEIASLTTLFAGTRRIVSLVPTHHIYGFLFTAMLPAALDVEVADGRGGFDWAPGDLVVGSPFHWQYLERTTAAFPSEAAGVSSGSPCPQDLRLAIQTKGLPLTDIYGSSQTAGIGYRQGPETAFQLMVHWTRSQNAAETCLLRNGSTPYELPDRLEWLDDRTFRVLGRRDGVVQVAGMNVSPEAIAARIRNHPDVADCAVRLMRPDEGGRLKAFVVWSPSVEMTPERMAAFESWLRDNFKSWERPARIDCGPELPRNYFGKLQDWVCSQ